MRLFRPLAPSFVQEVVSFFTGNRTEYNDPNFVASQEGRHCKKLLLL